MEGLYLAPITPPAVKPRLGLDMLALGGPPSKLGFDLCPDLRSELAETHMYKMTLIRRHFVVSSADILLTLKL